MILTPWPFQDKVIDDCLNYIKSYDGINTLSGYIVAPTGTGKSLMITHVVKRSGMNCLVLQPSIELLEQNYEKYTDHGGEASIYSASAKQKVFSDCMFATPGSLVGKGRILKNMFNIDLVIIDECHFKVRTDRDAEKEWGQVVQLLRDIKPKVIIGMTATPVRLLQQGGGATLCMLDRVRPRLFKDVISVVQIKDICEKYWKEIQYNLYDYDESELVLISKNGIEYKEESIVLANENNHVNNNIVKEAQRLILKEGVKSIMIFCDSVANGAIMNDWFNSKGISSVFVDGKTPKKKRKQYVDDFKKGDINIMVNYGTFTTGFDYPNLEVVMLGRATNSWALIYQILGRLLRISKLFNTGRFYDFCNNIKRVGRVESVTFDYIEGFGYGMFSGNRLMTGRPFAMQPYLMKSDIMEMIKDNILNDDTITFGEYEGCKVSEVPTKWIEAALASYVFEDRHMKRLEVLLSKEMENRSLNINVNI